MSVVNAEDAEELRRHTILVLEMILKKVKDSGPCSLVIGFADGEIAVGSSYMAVGTSLGIVSSSAAMSEIGKASALSSCVGLLRKSSGLLRSVE